MRTLTPESQRLRDIICRNHDRRTLHFATHCYGLKWRASNEPMDWFLMSKLHSNNFGLFRFSSRMRFAGLILSSCHPSSIDYRVASTCIWDGFGVCFHDEHAKSPVSETFLGVVNMLRHKGEPPSYGTLEFFDCRQRQVYACSFLYENRLVRNCIHG